MSLLWFAGFEFEDEANVWTAEFGDIVQSNPRTGAGSFTPHWNGETYRDLGADEDDEIIIGLALMNINGAAEDAFRIRFQEGGATTIHVEIRWDLSDKSITAHLGAGPGGTLLGATANNVWQLDVMSYYEIKVVIHDSAGSIEIRKDGAASPILSVSGIDTKNGGVNGLIDRVDYRCGVSNFLPFMDDMYICNAVDGTASQGLPNDDFLGDVKVYASSPSGNGNSSQLVGSDGNSTDNFQLVDEKATANDSDYVQSATAGEKDTYATEDLAPAAATVFGLAYHIRALKSDAGAISGRRVYRNAGVEDGGADLGLGTSAGNFIEYLFADPITDAAWTLARVNSREDGWEVRA